MDGVHDMGGMHGFGPIKIDAHEPLFHEEWEGRILGICRLLRIPVPGGMRNAIERLDPAEYLRTSYYEKWLLARIEGLIATGTITREEFAAKIAHYGAQPDAEIPSVPAAAPQVEPSRHENQEGALPPTFAVGDQVKARQTHPRGHTRLPRYIRGKVGVVVQIYRPQGFQDAEPLEDVGKSQTVYAVKFTSEQVWGESAEPNSSVLLDMWESYLERAST